MTAAIKGIADRLEQLAREASPDCPIPIHDVLIEAIRLRAQAEMIDKGIDRDPPRL
jgi:hypothetical protein